MKFHSQIKLQALDQHGFTLIELISVLIILGVLTTVAVKRFDLFSDTASVTILQSGIRELNTRETMAWSKIKLSDAGYTNDLDVYNTVDKSIGPGYAWISGPEITGGTLQYKSRSVALTRTASTSGSMGNWQ